MQGTKMRAWSFCFVLIFLAYIAGCAATAAYNRFYPGPEKPLSEIALLTEPNPYLRELVILKIDDKEIPFAGFTELLPGLHKISVLYYETSAGYKTTGHATFELNAQAGHVYEMYPVLHSHDDGWYVGLWDVTQELSLPEKQKLALKIDTILKKNRATHNSISAIVRNTSSKQNAPLPGFGERLAAMITGMQGRQTKVTYSFNRYQPRICVKADDGNQYHLKLSESTGEIEKVFGIKVTVGGFKAKYVAFQPIDSQIAYVYDNGKIVRRFQQIANGSYEELE